MRPVITILSFFLVMSCIPLRIAPNMEEGKIVKGRKFVKKLPSQYMYVFEDPKDANEFFNYINAKYQINYDDDLGNVPIIIEDKTYYLSFYEANKETQTVNLIPMVIDAALEEKGHGSNLESAYVSRKGTWYIALTITDTDLNDGFNPDYQYISEVNKYAASLREEYLSTAHYIEAYLKAE